MWCNLLPRAYDILGRAVRYTAELDSVHFTHLSFIPQRRENKLGAGTGLCGLVAGRCGASSVTFSDNDVQVYTDLLQNAIANKITQCTFLLLDWNYPTRNWQRQTFDVILAADTLFDKEVYEPFFRTLSLLLQSNTDAFCLLSVETRR
ncbi:7TM GPCR rhodopsin [Paragonimus heterotremus]|uniref:7TM GPCR rhodopsin n=1 Tax=Paragonimus heterotremus TaxID=100268 RepID=A0A8J4WG36_9TREM|nr:7TM GPCR rhodopsin [Paragonimus heterotremus]